MYPQHCLTVCPAFLMISPDGATLQADFKALIETIRVYVNFARAPTKLEVFIWIGA